MKYFALFHGRQTLVEADSVYKAQQIVSRKYKVRRLCDVVLVPAALYGADAPSTSGESK